MILHHNQIKCKSLRQTFKVHYNVDLQQPLFSRAPRPSHSRNNKLYCEGKAPSCTPIPGGLGGTGLLTDSRDRHVTPVRSVSLSGQFSLGHVTTAGPASQPWSSHWYCWEGAVPLPGEGQPFLWKPIRERRRPQVTEPWGESFHTVAPERPKPALLLDSTDNGVHRGLFWLPNIIGPNLIYGFPAILTDPANPGYFLSLE